jgi:hypothetical protein
MKTAKIDAEISGAVSQDTLCHPHCLLIVWTKPQMNVTNIWVILFLILKILFSFCR